MGPSPPDLGEPVSYLLLERGVPVLSSGGRKVGQVDEVRADFNADVFDGLVIETGPLALERRYVVAEQIDEIYERGVLLTLDADSVESLPVPPDVDSGE